uniref:Uncharacterized protein n=1 Tax=Cajanus cajan TaxID=3821 RepID=A0A151SEW6_CAJCA|nr:hypothetical protein KK1_024905 [Cajanus cajan]
MIATLPTYTMWGLVNNENLFWVQVVKSKYRCSESYMLVVIVRQKGGSEG